MAHQRCRLMPPKRALKPEPEPSAEDSEASEEHSPSPPLALHDELAASYAAMFEQLPHEVVLTQAVGVATRLSARLATLSHAAVQGDARIFKDCMRVVRRCLTILRPAVCELAGLELALVASYDRLSAGLREASPPRRRSRR